jgi:hypothetical protein
MPSLTNVHGLPEAIVKAVQNDPYSSGGANISVTKLIDAPQRRALWLQHHDHLTEDVSERIWALLGQAVHHILERAGTDTLVEQRLFAELEGWTLSGQFDRLHLASKTLSDYKVTTTYKAKGDASWTRQLNILRWLASVNDLAVDRLEIVAIFRDWRGGERDRNPEYPVAPVQVIPVEVWPLSETEAYIRQRIQLHQQAKAGEYIPCTDEERWYSGDKWALVRPGGKRALRVLETEPTDVPEGYVVEHRPGQYRRCASYCEVAPFCPQWASSSTPVYADPEP